MRQSLARCLIPSSHTPQHPLFELPFFPLGNAAHHAGSRSHAISRIVGTRYIVPSSAAPRFYQRRSTFTSFTSLASFTSLVQRFDNHSDALPSADARRRQPIAQSIPPQLIQNRNHQPRSRSPERVPQCNRPAVDIRFLTIQPQHLFYRKILRSKSLVHFHAIHLFERQSR